MDKTFYVGVAKEIITPKIGAFLTGFTPLRRSDSVHDDLNIVVFVFEQNGKRVLWASVDTCNVGDASEDIRRAMAKAADVPFENTYISATHNHSGPVLFVKPPAAEPNPDYVYGLLIPKAEKAAKKAASSMKKAETGVSSVNCNVTINRRHIGDDGKVSLEIEQEPLFVSDREMKLLSFRDYNGKSIGNIVYYGCHNTANGPNGTITRDWCGVMKDRIEEQLGGISAFINGGEGDCGPRFSHGRASFGDMKDVIRIGEHAFRDAIRAYNKIKEWKRDAPLNILQGNIEIPYEDAFSAEELRKMVEEIREKGEKASVFEIAAAKKYEFRIAHPEKNERSRIIPTTAFSIGDTAFLPSDFELFARTVLRIKRRSPFEHTVVTSVTNGRGGYLPPEDQIPLGGYEVDAGYYLRERRYVKNAEQYFYSGAVNLLDELKNGG